MCEAGLRLGEGYRSPKSRPRLSGSCVEGTITFTLPVLEPDAVGEKVTLIAQLPFGPNGDPGDSASPVGASAKAGEVEGRDDTLAVWGVDFDGYVRGSRIGRVVFLPDNKTR